VTITRVPCVCVIVLLRVCDHIRVCGCGLRACDVLLIITADLFEGVVRGVMMYMNVDVSNQTTGLFCRIQFALERLLCKRDL